MSIEHLVQHLPPAVRYRREALDDEQNALWWWDRAARRMVRMDEALAESLAVEGAGRNGAAIAINESNIDRVRRFLEANRESLELVRAGVRCGRVQFPELEEEGGSVSEHAESMDPLAELPQTWFILAQVHMADRDWAAAAAELIGLGEMGHMICCGQGLVMHYLMGRAIMAMGLVGIRRLAIGQTLPDTVLADLNTAVERWIANAGDAAQCLRVELCTFALREIDQFAAAAGLEEMVDRLLDRHYANEPVVEAETASLKDAIEEDDRLAWRRDWILRLLEGHPAAFDKTATVRMLGEHVADEIEDLMPLRRFDVLGRWRRLKRAYRHSRFRSRCRIWPTQLRPAFPYEYLGPGDGRQQLAEIEVHVTARRWADMQPPAEARFEALRQRIHALPNALGVLIADALTPTDLPKHERARRRVLQAVQTELARALDR